MRKISTCLLVVLFAGGSAFAGPARDQEHHERSDENRGPRIAAFGTMYGVDGPFVGEAFEIRGIPGDEFPWEVREARGFLDTDGHLTIKVRGLVFKDAPGVPPDLVGINDEAEFRGLVSCLTEEGESVTTVNRITPGFRATRSGDSDIRATLDLPNPCVAPIIMVLAGSEEKWFAVDGFEAEGHSDAEKNGAGNVHGIHPRASRELQTHGGIRTAAVTAR